MTGLIESAAVPASSDSASVALLELEDLVVEYVDRDRRVRAVDHGSLTIGAGEIVGLAGESGCGKTTAADAILQILRPPALVTGGRILFRGRDMTRHSTRELRRYRWRNVSMVFQNAMSALNPVMRVGDQFVDMMQAHERIRSRQALKRAGDLLGLVGIDRGRGRSYPHELSGGMRQRVIIAMALALGPELVIMDEPTTALDVVVQREILQELLRAVGLVPPEKIARKYPHELSGGQRQRVAIARALAVDPAVILADEPISMLDVSIRIGILNLMADLKRDRNIAFLYITHDIASARYVADEVLVMYAGQIVEQGPTDEVLQNPLHPYTQLLLSAVPNPAAGEWERIEARSGRAALVDPHAGCRFAPRCPVAVSASYHVTPELIEPTPGHRVRCHLYQPATP